MSNSFFQKINLMGGVSNTSFGMNVMPSGKLDSLDEAQPTSFKDVMGGLAQGLNNDLAAPDKLLKGVMAGDSDVDVHDVMTAMAKAELSISVATQITSKVIQAYDKIMQISV
jgi:flagellar hook-basal body complex protein FliE